MISFRNSHQNVAKKTSFRGRNLLMTSKAVVRVNLYFKDLWRKIVLLLCRGPRYSGKYKSLIEATKALWLNGLEDWYVGVTQSSWPCFLVRDKRLPLNVVLGWLIFKAAAFFWPSPPLPLTHREKLQHPEFLCGPFWKGIPSAQKTHTNRKYEYLLN